MKKCIKQPPLIVILDVIFIFLFALILKPEDSIAFIKLPQNVNPPFTLVVALSKDNKINYYFDEKSNQWKKLSFCKDYKIIVNNQGFYNAIFTDEKRNIFNTIKQKSKNKIEDKKILTMVYGTLYYEVLKLFYENNLNKKQKVISIYSNGSIENLDE